MKRLTNISISAPTVSYCEEAYGDNRVKNIIFDNLARLISLSLNKDTREANKELVVIQADVCFNGIDLKVRGTYFCSSSVTVSTDLHLNNTETNKVKNIYYVNLNTTNKTDYSRLSHTSSASSVKILR